VPVLRLTFRQLSVFQAVARHLSYTRAAEELHLSQPAVSMQIHQLEEQVGLPVFEQIGKKIYLTQAGQELLPYAQAIARQLADAAEVMADLRGMRQGRLRVSVATTANYFAPRLLATFTQRFSGIKVTLAVTTREGLLRHLENNDVDIVIMGKPPAELEVVAEPFMDNPLVMIAAPDHPLTQRQQIPLAELQNQTFLVRERGSGTRIAMERCFQEQQLLLSTGMEMNTDEAIKQGVQAGLGLGIVSWHTLRLELELGRLVMLSVDSFPILRHWYIVHRQGRRLSAVAEAFRSLVLAEARSLSSSLGD
jgi:LysR family transcriptional regulator, low CO2-responsive transcriptional regulator